MDNLIKNQILLGILLLKLVWHLLKKWFAFKIAMFAFTKGITYSPLTYSLCRKNIPLLYYYYL